jgi:hypothetical protein
MVTLPDAVDAVSEGHRIERLEDDIRDPGLAEALELFLLDDPSEVDDRYFVTFWPSSDFLEDLGTRHIRHQYVDDHQIRLELREPIEKGFPRRAHRHLETTNGLECNSRDLEDVGLVVGKEYSLQRNRAH